ncbi:PACE efflux transporter [Uliginosibacterium sp. H1]|uniref:PACE efflux transporter n=1 Tax=Uliginosibacterium sp. H1 TaxID=3114757 RepID=UPI002E19A3EE|nr:PACE efflux transporter [Uliginosibacterium sp. H1]
MQGFKRKIVQALSYEAIAIVLVTAAVMAVSDHDAASSGGLAAATSLIALTWNMLYNTGFEAWEARQASRERTLLRRVLHALGFEAGLVFFIVPVIAWWLEVSLLQALVMDIGLIVFFMFYTMVFTWCFDRVFGLPASARAVPACEGC